MLNLITPDINDQKVLEESYNAFRNKEAITIITEPKERESAFRQITDNLRMANSIDFSIQNLFKSNNGKGNFYIAQCFIDFGYPLGSKGSQTFEQKYYYQIVGLAKLTVDLGDTHLRPETVFDKVINRIFQSDISIDGAHKFNEKYFLISTKKSQVLKCFDKCFSNTIANYDDVIIRTKGKQIFLSFASDFNSSQTRTLEHIFMNLKWLDQE